MAKKDEAREGLDEEVLENGSRVYELGFHLDPELPTEEVKKAYQNVREVVAKAGTIVAEGEPLMTQLAYTISIISRDAHTRRDFNSAYFCWVAYEASAENHERVIEAVKEDARVIRYIDLVTTKDAARHSQELRELAAKAPAGAESEEASEAALDAALENAAV